jgi:hypothetical protein
MSWGVYKREDRSFLVEFDRLMYVNVKLTTKGFQRENTEPIWARGLVGRPRSSATLRPQKFWDFS